MSVLVCVSVVVRSDIVSPLKLLNVAAAVVVLNLHVLRGVRSI
jgi:hypothetical protein